MKRILLISDNHGDRKSVIDILQKEKYDVSVHLGDSLMYEDEIKGLFDIYVSGNNEVFSTFEETREIEGLKFVFIHGHTAGIIDFREEKPGFAFAKERGADVLAFGHTHTPYLKTLDGITLINPGSTSAPRNDSNKSYAIMTVDNKKIESVKFKNL